jgi:hypothetical protein
MHGEFSFVSPDGGVGHKQQWWSDGKKHVEKQITSGRESLTQ